VAQETAPTFDHLPDPIRERVHLEVCAVDGVSQASGRPIRRRRGSNICRDGRPDWPRAAGARAEERGLVDGAGSSGQPLPIRGGVDPSAPTAPPNLQGRTVPFNRTVA
jgi:hypothetical protein